MVIIILLVVIFFLICVSFPLIVLLLIYHWLYTLICLSGSCKACWTALTCIEMKSDWLNIKIIHQTSLLLEYNHWKGNKALQSTLLVLDSVRLNHLIFQSALEVDQGLSAVEISSLQTRTRLTCEAPKLLLTSCFKLSWLALSAAQVRPIKQIKKDSPQTW